MMIYPTERPTIMSDTEQTPAPFKIIEWKGHQLAIRHIPAGEYTVENHKQVLVDPELHVTAFCVNSAPERNALIETLGHAFNAQNIHGTIKPSHQQGKIMIAFDRDTDPEQLKNAIATVFAINPKELPIGSPHDLVDVKGEACRMASIPNLTPQTSRSV